MNAMQSGSIILKIAILLGLTLDSSSVATVLGKPFPKRNAESLTRFVSPSGTVIKDNCNCPLAAQNRSEVFKTDAIAVSFVVTVHTVTNHSNKHLTNKRTSFKLVWVRKKRAKFLLALPDDSEILSLTTLQHCVETGSVNMSPLNNSQCFDSLPSLCQVKVIVGAFYHSHDFHVADGQPFCFPPLETKNQSKDFGIVHRCCTWNSENGKGYINCTETIFQNDWVAYAIYAVQLGSVIMFLLSPLVFKYLPTRDTQIVRRSRQALPRRLGYSSVSAMSVDSVTSSRKLLTLVEPLSFVTWGGGEAQACYSRLCRAVMLFIFPSIFCVYVVVFFLRDQKAKIRTNVSYYTGLVGFLKPPVEYYVFCVVAFCIVLLGILVLIPGRLCVIGKALSGRRDEKFFLGFEKPEHLVNHRSGKAGFQFLYANMVFHLKCCFDVAFWLFILKVGLSPCSCLFRSCCATPDDSTEISTNSEENDQAPTFCIVLGFVFLPVIMVMWITLVLCALIVYITPVGYVAFRICRLLYNQDLPFKSECCERLPTCIRLILVVILYWVFILFCISVLCSYVFVQFMFGVFFWILGKIFLYTLIGLGFNVNFFITYTVGAFFVLFYMWRAFSHYVSVYENLRIVLFEECEKYEQQETLNGKTSSTEDSDVSPQSSGTGLLLLDYNNNPAIPLNLFIATYRRLRPRGRTFCTIFVKFALTLVYLSVAFASIMSLDKADDTSSYVQAGFLCATFVFPLILLHGSTSHSRRRRKELEYQVRFIIHRYVSKVISNNQQSGSPTSTVDLHVAGDDLFEI